MASHLNVEDLWGSPFLMRTLLAYSNLLSSSGQQYPPLHELETLVHLGFQAEIVP